MSLYGKYVSGGEKAWLYFNTTPGQMQYGDYGYQQAYAKERDEHVRNGKTYVLVKILDVVWKYKHVCFNVTTISKDGKELYKTQVYDPERLKLLTFI